MRLLWSSITTPSAYFRKNCEGILVKVFNTVLKMTMKCLEEAELPSFTNIGKEHLAIALATSLHWKLFKSRHAVFIHLLIT